MKSEIKTIMTEIFGSQIKNSWIGEKAIRNKFNMQDSDLCCDGVVQLDYHKFILVEDKDSEHRKLLKHGIEQLKLTAKFVQALDEKNTAIFGFMFFKSPHSGFYTKNKNYRRNEYYRLKQLNSLIKLINPTSYIFVGLYGATINQLCCFQQLVFLSDLLYLVPNKLLILKLILRTL